MIISNVKKAIGSLFEVGMTPILVGGHGKGKTEVVRQWSAENGYDLIEVRLGQMSDSADLIGVPHIKDGVTYFARPSFLPSKKKTVIFLDEINRAHKDLIQAVFQLILEKKIHEYELPEDCHVIAACNPDTEDYTVLDFKDKAYSDRFCYIDFNPSVEEWLAYGRDAKFSGDMLDFFTVQKDLLDSSKDTFDYNTVSPSRRSVKFASDLEKIVTDTNLFREILFGIFGSTVSTLYMQFKKERYDSLVDVDEVLNNFESQRSKVNNWLETKNVEAIQKSSSLIIERLTSMVESKTPLTNENHTNLEEFYLLAPDEIAYQFIKSCVEADLMQTKDKPHDYKIQLFESDRLFAKLKPYKEETKKGK